MIVHKIHSKSDPIFLRKVKSADRDLDKTLHKRSTGTHLLVILDQKAFKRPKIVNFFWIGLKPGGTLGLKLGLMRTK